MYHTLSDLIQDLQERVSKLEIGDTVTIGWFSSEGQYRFPIKGFRLGREQDRPTLLTLLETLNSTIGTTCFSEILNDLSDVLDELKALDQPTALTFLTDGHPVVSNHQREIANISSAIKKLSGRILSVLLVGYGNYYNKSLMAQMATEFGGSLIHADDLPSFKLQFGTFIEESRDAATRMTVPAPFGETNLGGVFMVSGKRVTLLEKDDKGQINVPVPRRGVAKVYGLSSTVDPLIPLIDFIEPDVEACSLTKGAYAAAFVTAQQHKTDLSLEVIGFLGDVHLSNLVANAFTPSDDGKAEAAILRAVERKDGRMKAGWKPGCVPKRDAFCVLDVVDLLVDDEDARFYPYHPDFKYNRIGAGSVTREGYPDFKADQNPSCDFEKLTWNQTFLNLSIQVQIPGSIELDDQHATFGLPKEYRTHVFRNYALIRDGFLNAPSIVVSMNKTTFARLVAEGIVQDTWKAGKPIMVDLYKLPVMNRSMADGKTSAVAMAEKLRRELRIMAELKVLNGLLKEARPENQGGAQITATQADYLKTQGVTHNGFSPPTDPIPTTDVYSAKEFDIKISSFNSLPSLNDVRKRANEITESLKDAKKKPKTFTPSQELLWEFLEPLEGKPVDSLLLQRRVDKLKPELRELRSQIQRTKFSIVLGGKWFDELSTRDGAQLEHNNLTFTFTLREVEIRI